MMSDLFTHGVTGTQWPWMLPGGTPGTPVRDRRRKRGPGLIARLLARLRPPSGNHRAPPAAPAEDPQPPAPSWDSRCSPGAVTLMDFTDMRVPGYMRQEGRHHAPGGGGDVLESLRKLEADGWRLS